MSTSSGAPFSNIGVPGAYEYFPLNSPDIGTVREGNEQIPLLFKPLTIKGIEFKNRIFVSPMCQYSADNGHATDWHFVHLGGFATRGVGAICIEATAVVPEGRISPEDLGLWTDSQIAPLKKIVEFSHAQGTKIGIQLAHAGRKASVHAPWVRDRTGRGRFDTAPEEAGGWPNAVFGPSDIPFADSYPAPKALTERGLLDIENAFVASIERCKEIGFDFVEIHGAHGYLLHSFVSPLSNNRTDIWGGQSLENRLRFFLRIIKRVREAWAGKPLFVRISAADWAEGPEKDDNGVWKQWGIEQSTILVGKLRELGIDLLDCSSGGNWVKQKFTLVPGYQVPYAEVLKKAYPNQLVGAVGLITEPNQAEEILQKNQADVVFLGRELLRDPHWAMKAAKDLNVKVKTANQYERAWPSLL
ncbi:putative NADH:flavin oxidoreductase 1 [Pholiota conissans]|uniref:NADH:flavin oxidoreductase 1 n=1 Tax=Pholiota conissans TaxID=109636 RepID=A0A9P5Z7Z5_9AGAR|nr:putative NADH:flavin oxidoreductase 1 [Pholiota conissans]